MSAPISPGGFKSVSASGSAATQASAPAACRPSITAVKSWQAPSVPGYWNSAPKTPAGSRSANGSPTTTVQPSGSARVRITSIVCGWASRSTKKAEAFDVAARWQSAIASAAAVASSSSEALATSSPVRSATMVWKLSSASSRPWLISGWYGV